MVRSKIAIVAIKKKGSMKVLKSLMGHFSSEPKNGMNGMVIGCLFFFVFLQNFLWIYSELCMTIQLRPLFSDVDKHNCIYTYILHMLYKVESSSSMKRITIDYKLWFIRFIVKVFVDS